ncbi:hypothetical protein RHSIM_Rhsim02G0009300 [Rhododendron simsii]|uniref:Pectinesterase inhibitor domain-containing protein n=1 Tax=Rhododendron simsii TaxID=118357 RepID=A0A834HH06_RHOSS|nr:hypothetical protein RHSIM_Rhsim02G0009300 [Rhododendron simsii]
MAKVEVSFTLILCFLSFALLASSPEALAAPLKNAAKKVDGDGFETLGKKAGLVRHLCNETGHYNLCVAAVEADPRSNLKSHRKGILQIVMDSWAKLFPMLLQYSSTLIVSSQIILPKWRTQPGIRSRGVLPATTIASMSSRMPYHS